MKDLYTELDEIREVMGTLINCPDAYDGALYLGDGYFVGMTINLLCYDLYKNNDYIGSFRDFDEITNLLNEKRS